MDKKQIEMEEQEISLVDILKMIWKYKWFIIGFTLVLTVIGILFFYYNDFIKKDNNHNQYLITLNMPKISYEFYQNLKLNLNYDFNSKYLSNSFNINSIKVYSKEIKNEPYKINDFPINSLQIDIIFNKNLDEKSLNNFENYLKDIIFEISIKETISLLKSPLYNLSNQSQFFDKNSSLLFLFFTELSNNIDYIFNLNNRNIQKDYELVKEYLNSLKLDNSYLIYANKIFLDILDKQFLYIDSMEFYSSQNAVEKPSYKSLLKKAIVIFFTSIFFSFFLIFIIDFFKKNWKEIVKS